MNEFKEGFRSVAKFASKTSFPAAILLGSILGGARSGEAKPVSDIVSDSSNAHNLYINDPSLVDKAIENARLNIPSKDVLANATSSLDWRCDPNRFWVSKSFDFQDKHWIWNIDNIQPGDPDQNNIAGIPTGAVAVCADNEFQFSFQTNGAWYRNLTSTGSSIEIASVEVYPEKNWAIIGTRVHATGNRLFENGGEKLNDLLTPRDLNKRVIIPSSGLSRIEVTGAIEQSMYYTDNWSNIIDPVRTALSSNNNGDYSISTNSLTGDPLPGASFIRLDSRIVTPTGTKTATVTSTAIPTATSTPRVTITPTSTSETSLAGRNFGITTEQTGVMASWTGGTPDINYLLARISPSGVSVLPRTGPIPGTISIYMDTERTSDSFKCYTLVLIDRSGPRGNSDLLCAFPNTRTGSGPSEFTIRLNQSNIASLSWRGLSNLTGNVLVPFGRESIGLPATVNNTTNDTRGNATCYTVVGFQGTQATGNSDVLCGVPGFSRLN